LFRESLAAEAPANYDYLDRLNGERATSGLPQRVLAEVVPLTTHGSFDDRRVYGTQYRKFASMVQAGG
jgi:hypothetical protein